MPEFIFNNKLYYHSVEFALDRIGGTWKMPILWRLKNKAMRYGEIKKDIPRISDKVLSDQLKQLEKDGFITRKVFAEVPVKVEYALTLRGKRAIKVITIMRNYGTKLIKEFKVKESKK
jgi:DNA-binding HxlR family transcriptional regulator